MLNQLDNTDIRILQLLQDNARLTNKEIGLKLHKSPSSVNDRVRRLQEQGYIKKYIAVLDHKKLNRGLMAFTHLQIRDHSKQSLLHFESEIIKLPEVIECYHMSGQFDFILRVVTKDLDSYHDFLMNKIFETIPLAFVQSTFVMKTAKAETGFAVELGIK